MICVCIFMTGTPEGSTKSDFMEKPGIEPMTLPTAITGMVNITQLLTSMM